MPKPDDAWIVHRHGPIESLSPRVRRVEGRIPKMDLLRVMTIAKRSDDRLVIHNGIALEEDGMKAIDDWGTPAFIIVPNGYHRLDAAAFARRYPNAKIVCPAGARKRVADVVAVDLTYDAYPQDDAVRIEHLDGVKDQEGVMIVRDEDGATLVFNDAVFNCPHGEGVSGFVLRHITGSTGGPKVTRLFRWAVMKDRERFRASLKRLAETPDLRRIIVSHHVTITEEPAATLGRIADAL